MLTAGVTPLFGDQVVDYNDHYRHQQAGADATDEHFTDGGVCQRAVHNHSVAGGDDQPMVPEAATTAAVKALS